MSFELRNAIAEFLLSKDRECLLTNPEFVSDVGYLADINFVTSTVSTWNFRERPRTFWT